MERKRLSFATLAGLASLIGVRTAPEPAERDERRERAAPPENVSSSLGWLWHGGFRTHHRGGFPAPRAPLTPGDFARLAAAEDKRARKRGGRLIQEQRMDEGIVDWKAVVVYSTQLNMTGIFLQRRAGLGERAHGY